MSDYQRRLYQQQYIQKLHQASEPGVRWLMPEAYFIGPRDTETPRSVDKDWFSFLTKQQKTKQNQLVPQIAGWSRGGVVNQSLERVGNFITNINKAKAFKWFAIGVGALWATNKVFSSFSTDKYYGLSREQQDVVEWHNLGPKYKNLSRRFQQELYKVEDEKEAQRRFKLAKLSLDKYGREVGTGHKRILLPYEMFSEKQIKEDLGFVPVNIAIPEAGQTTFTSYRHPNNLYHLHKHPSYWTMHKDEHAASTMLSKKRFMQNEDAVASNIAGSVGDFFTGLPHIITEGVPGLYYYLKGQIQGTEGMQQRLLQEMPQEYNRVLGTATGRWHASSVRGLLPYQRIPGKDDAYNTIHGMNESGLAGRLRKQNTDFGSGYANGLKMMGIGASALATLGLLGHIRKAPTADIDVSVKATKKDNEGFSFFTKAAIGISAFVTLSPALTYATARLKGKMGHKLAFGLAQSSAKASTARFIAGSRAVRNMYSKENTEFLSKEAIKTGIYTDKKMRALAPVFETAKAVSHTANWLKKNWTPELKKGEIGAVGLGALTVYEGYNIGKSAYEGEWGDVGSGLVSFAAAKYGYMGWHKFLNSPEKRKNAFRWAKKQKISDILAYVSMGANITRTTATAGVHAVALYPQFVRTGASPNSILKTYGLENVKQFARAGGDIAEDYKKAWEKLPEEMRDNLLSEKQRKELFESAQIVASEVKDAVTMSEEEIADVIQKFAEGSKKDSETSWLLGKLTERLGKINPKKPASLRDKIVEKLQEGWANIPTENRPVNGFDGMPHGGLASEQRRNNTPFGSKYDRVRALAKMMGETFESITRSKEFRSALSEATVIKELGAGTFGKAELMETTFQGEKLQFVRKRLHEGIREKIFREAANPEKYLGSLSLRHEGTIMSKLGTTEAVPSVYRTSEKELFMEAMPGTEIYRLMDKGGQVPQGAIAKLRKTAQEVAEAGIENLDIHQGNIMFDPVSQRVSWIDWGQAQKTGRAATSVTMEKKLVAATTPTPVSTTPATPVMRGKKKRAQIAQLSNNTPATPLMKPKKNKFAQVPQSSQTERTVIGRKKVPEGMMHGGMAASKRKATTEFGSGWRGLFGGLSGKIKKFWGKADQSAEKLLDPRRAAKMAENQSLEDFAKQLGGDIRVLGRTKYTGTEEEIIKKKVFEEMAIKQGAGAGFVPGDMIYIHPETSKLRAIEKARQMGIDESLVKDVVEKEDFMKTLLYHEYLEKQSMARFGGAMKMAGPGAKHQAGQVIFGEAGFVSQLKDENIKKFFTQLRKTKTEEKTFAAGFDAFSKGDVAAELRPLLTDFASPWRGLIDGVSIEASQTMASQSGRASRKLLESSYDLRKAQEQLWDLANNAGKGHSKYAGRHVKQLSRFGGNL